MFDTFHCFTFILLFKIKIINQHAHQNYTIYHCNRLAPAKEGKKAEINECIDLGDSQLAMEFLFVNYGCAILYISKIYDVSMYVGMQMFSTAGY